jgi:hypothetical protein
MGCLIEKLVFKKGVDKVDTNSLPNELWSIKVNDIDGNTKLLNDYTKNMKLFIFVNVACK